MLMSLSELDKNITISDGCGTDVCLSADKGLAEVAVIGSVVG